MRFRTRYDTWMVVVLVAIGLLIVTVPAAVYATGTVPWTAAWMFLFGPAVMAFVLSATLPQYYEVRDDGLFIRQGWKKALLPYSALREVSTGDSILSAPVFSTHRLLVTAAPGGQFLIAVAEQEKFLSELARRAPHLQQRPSGLRARNGSPSGSDLAAGQRF